MLTDNQVTELVLKGEKDAFAAIIRRYHKRIFQLAYRLVWSREEAEDMTQEVFLRTYQNLSKFSQEAEFYPWLRSLALNSMLTHLKRGAWRRGEVPYLEAVHSGQQLNAEQLALKKERTVKLLASLAELEPLHRTILTLRAIEGLSYEQIATELECSLGTVMSRLNRARTMLKDKLKRSQ